MLQTSEIHFLAQFLMLDPILRSRIALLCNLPLTGLHILAPRAVQQQYPIRQVPTYPIFYAVKATILHVGTIWGWIGWVVGGFKTVFLVILGLLKFVKIPPTEFLWGV